MFLKPYFPLAVLLGLAVGSCSGVDPSEEAHACGTQISMDHVTVVDLRPVVNEPEQVEEFIRDQVGEYRLTTTKPIGVNVRNSKRFVSHYGGLHTFEASLRHTADNNSYSLADTASSVSCHSPQISVTMWFDSTNFFHFSVSST